MTPEDARKLLGGYATGTLTDAEEQALFAAALEDQALFDELAGEQGLRELLVDPATRGRLLAALDEPRRSWWRSWKPAAGALAMAGLAAVAVVVGTRRAPEAVQLVAKVDAPPAVVPVAPRAEIVAETRPAPPPAARRKFQPPAPKEQEAKPATLAEAPQADALKAEAAEARAKVLADAPVRRPTPLDSAGPRVFNQVAAAAPQAFAETVEVTASARSLFFGVSPSPSVRIQTTAAVSARTATVQTIGLRYSLVRREGEDTVTIRFTANVNGYLSIGGGQPVSLTAMQPYLTEALSGDEAKIVFAREPQTSLATPVAPLTEVSGGDTFVVNTIPSRAIGFTIPLKQK
jgi:hypothetical protein